MNIHELEERIEGMTDVRYVAIIELIIEAVRDYPVPNLIDTGIFFELVNSELSGQGLTALNLTSLIDSMAASKDHSALWVVTSLTSLLEAVKLMEQYGITFDEVVRKIEE